MLHILNPVLTSFQLWLKPILGYILNSVLHYRVKKYCDRALEWWSVFFRGFQLNVVENTTMSL